MAMASNSPAFVNDRTFLKPNRRGITRSIPIIKRPARFWYGASLPFRVEESVDVLNTRIESCNFYEAIGVAYDVQLVVSEVNENLELLDRESVAQLLHGFETLSQYIRYCLEAYIIAVKSTQPVQPQTDRTVQAWFDAVNEFIIISRDFASQWEMQPLWISLHEHTREDYRKRMAQVISSGALVGSDDSLVSQHSIIIPPSFLFQSFDSFDGIMSEETTEERVWAVFKSIIAYYKYWCQQEISAQSIVDFQFNFWELRHAVEPLLSRPSKTKSTPRDTFIGARAQLIYVGWCSHFHHKFERTIRETLTSSQSVLEANIHNKMDAELAERQIFQLAHDIRGATFLKPHNVCRRAWSVWVPRMLDTETYDALIYRLQLTSNDLQHQLSASCEIKSLWFDLYKSLITTYMILRDTNFMFPDRTFPLERAFFLDTKCQSALETIMREPMIANPEMVEDVVGAYCISIGYARIANDLETARIRLYSEKELKQTEQNVNHNYHRTQKWEPIAIRVMQKMAVRLNYLTGGPGYIRRAQVPSRYWDMQHVELPVPPTHQTPRMGLRPDSHEDQVVLMAYQQAAFDARQNPARVRFAIDMKRSSGETLQFLDRIESRELDKSTASLQAAKSVTMKETVSRRLTPAATGTPSVGPNVASEFSSWGGVFASSDAPESESGHNSSSASRPENDATAELVGINYISSFDYVNCPFPETRAMEVTVSRQVSRELADTNIISTGPEVEDVINRPPRHTRTPSQVSIISQYLPYGPWDLLKALWGKSKVTKHAKQRLSITPRFPRRVSKRKHHDPLSPSKDSFRVAKPNSSRSQTCFTGVPKLRGGGTRLHTDEQALDTPDASERPTTPPLGANDRPSTGNTPNAGSLTQQVAASLSDIPSFLVDQGSQASFPANIQDHGATVASHEQATRNTQPLDQVPADFTIFQDPSSGCSPARPATAPNSSPPAGNQAHEAQRQAERERIQQGLPPRRSSDNSSDQENQRPGGILQSIEQDSSSSDQDITPRAAQCLAVACHRCPVLQNQFHHVCPGLTTNQPVPSSQPTTSTDPSSQVLRSIEFPDILNVPSSSDPGRNGSGSSADANSSSGGDRRRSEIPDSQPDENTTTTRTAARSTSNQRSQIPDSQADSSSVTVPGANQSGTQTGASTVAPASTTADLSTPRGRGSRGGRARGSRPRGTQSRASISASSSTRVTRRALAQINAQQPAGVSLNLAQIQAQGVQALLSPVATQAPTGPVTPGQGGSAYANQTTNQSASQSAGQGLQVPSSQPGTPQGGSVSPPSRGRGRGRAGTWNANVRGSPTSSNAANARADLTDPTATRSPTPPPRPNPHRGQLGTARHPHDSSGDEFSGEETPSPTDDPAAAHQSGTTPLNLIRPIIPGILRPIVTHKRTRPTLYRDRMNNDDPFTDPPPSSPRPTRQPTVQPTRGNANSTVTKAPTRNLSQTAAAALRVMDTQALAAGIALPRYSDGTPLASANTATDPTTRRSNSDRVRRAAAAAAAATAGTNAGAATTTMSRGTRGVSEMITRREKRSAPDDFDDDLRRSRRRGA